MKKLFLLLGFVAATVSAEAITTPKNESQSQKSRSIERLTEQAPANNSLLFSNQKQVETQSTLSYTPMGWGDFSSNFSIGANVSPFVYDPLTKSYHVAGMYRTFTNNVFQGSRTHVYRLQDGKFLWDSIPMVNKPGETGAFFPSIGVINPNKSTNVDELSTMLCAAAIKPSGPNWTFQGALFLMGTLSGTAPFTKELIIDEEFQNVSNTFGTTQAWQISRIGGTSNDAAKPALYTVGTLSPATGQQFGYYGYSGINPDGSEFQNKIPDQWNITNFRASTAISSSFQGPIEVDTDLLGNVYAACFNLPVASGDGSFSSRVPMISKSSNYGATWSDFVICPEDKIKEYAVVNGYAELATSRVSPYQKNAFVVYGNDKYSFFFRGELLSESSTPGELMVEKASIFEAKYDAGTWTINLVADLRQTGLVVFERDNSNTSATVFDIVSHDLGNEIQASKTKDGQNIILKWIDVNPSLIDVITPPVTNFFQETFNNPSTGMDEKRFVSVDTVDVSDVYVNYRPVGSNIWTNPVNITNDKIWNHSTWIPPIVESLSDMALLSPRVLSTFSPTFPALQFQSVSNRITLGTNFRYTFSRFNLLTTTVSEEKAMPIVIENVYPSIATDQASVNFTAPADVHASVEVSNINGEVVKSVFNGLATNGQNLFGFDVTDMPNGVYFVTVKAGGTVQSSKFTVLR